LGIRGSFEAHICNGQPKAAREPLAKSAFTCWMDLDLVSYLPIIAAVSYWDHMYRHIEKWHMWVFNYSSKTQESNNYCEKGSTFKFGDNVQNMWIRS